MFPKSSSIPIALYSILSFGLVSISQLANAQDFTPPKKQPPQYVKPTPEIGKGPFPLPSNNDLIERAVEVKKEVIDHQFTFAILDGIVIDTEPVVFTVNNSNQDPHIDIYTKVTAFVQTSYKNELVGFVEFWVHGGIVDESDRLIGYPYAVFGSNDIRLEASDIFLACVSSNLTLPDGKEALILIGGQSGVSFPGSPQSEFDATVAQIAENYIDDNFTSYFSE